MKTAIYHGDIVYAATAEKLSVHKDSYLVVEDGFVRDIFPVLPEEYAALPVTDYGRGLIIPAFSDLHIHASQYVQRGIGMDKLLFDWLNDYTFPQESRFASMDYAKSVYDCVVADFLRHGTFHSSVFTTIHYDASSYLFRAMENKGLYGYVGKVNMDRNSPDYLCESTEESLRETERFLEEHSGGSRVKPILTPRFAPTCSEELLFGLGKLGKKYGCGLQTHLSESLAEVQWTLELFPAYRSDGEIYQRAGLLDNGPSIFAHVIFPSEVDLEVIKGAGSVCVHCPDATTNVIAGIMPACNMVKDGIKLAMGTDVGAAPAVPVYRQIASAVRLSKLKEFYEPENRKLSFAQAFYMGTKSGGSVFDRVGSLEKGYRFNALVLDGLDDCVTELSAEERLERFCYTGDDRNIIARYLDGKEVSGLI